MSPSPASRPRRAGHVLLDVVLRAVGLAASAAAVPTLSGETDALALGLTVFLVLASLAFSVALLDGLLQRDRVHAGLVWGVVVPLVALLEVGDHLRGLVTGPGAYPSLQLALASPSASPGELASTVLFYLVLVGVPAAGGLGLGLLLRLLTPPAPEPVRP